MHLKIRCDGESEKFCKIFWEVNKTLELLYILLQEYDPYIFHRWQLRLIVALEVQTKSAEWVHGGAVFVAELSI